MIPMIKRWILAHVLEAYINELERVYGGYIKVRYRIHLR